MILKKKKEEEEERNEVKVRNQCKKDRERERGWKGAHRERRTLCFIVYQQDLIVKLKEKAGARMERK